MTEQQQLHITSAEADVDVEVLMGEGPATLTGGIGGWQVSDRPDAIGVTQWLGNSPITQDVPLLLNGFISEDSIQGQMNQITRLGRNPQGDEVPPTFKMHGPVHYPHLVWVLEGADWGEVERDEDRTLLRQEVTLHVIEYNDGDQLKIKKHGTRGKKKTGGTSYPGSSYTVRKGDTLGKIAADLYGDRSVWKKIGQKNGIRDPNKELKPGTVLKLPADPYGSNGN